MNVNRVILFYLISVLLVEIYNINCMNTSLLKKTKVRCQTIYHFGRPRNSYDYDESKLCKKVSDIRNPHDVIATLAHQTKLSIFAAERIDFYEVEDDCAGLNFASKGRIEKDAQRTWLKLLLMQFKTLEEYKSSVTSRDLSLHFELLNLFFYDIAIVEELPLLDTIEDQKRTLIAYYKLLSPLLWATRVYTELPAQRSKKILKVYTKIEKKRSKSSKNLSNPSQIRTRYAMYDVVRMKQSPFKSTK